MYRLFAGDSAGLCRYDGGGISGICRRPKETPKEGSKKADRRSGGSDRTFRGGAADDQKFVQGLSPESRPSAGYPWFSGDHYPG